ncbi:hypothetical protein IC617_01230 [Neiella sp. HB171785]|uniref:Uncharacterized protein n=1 Tax=Neiella litorisoli TaxID=2771431 RepID=A0A8J6QNR8_9GAMM|nr:hypothetical protein [Neiella litorisoli]MBD1388039.1 hypothetical protein [Neiella litorisoli]
MHQFELIQFGFVVLFGFMLLVGAKVVMTYLKADKPPENSMLLIAMLLGLSVIGGISGFACVERTVANNEVIAATTETIHHELEQVRNEYQAIVTPLQKAREKALFASSYAGNLRHEQDTQYARAQQLTEMIELEEARYQSKLQRVYETFAAVTDNKIAVVARSSSQQQL